MSSKRRVHALGSPYYLACAMLVLAVLGGILFSVPQTRIAASPTPYQALQGSEIFVDGYGGWQLSAHWVTEIDELVNVVGSHLGLPVSQLRTYFASSYAGFTPHAVPLVVAANTTSQTLNTTSAASYVIKPRSSLPAQLITGAIILFLLAGLLLGELSARKTRLKQAHAGS